MFQLITYLHDCSSWTEYFSCCPDIFLFHPPPTVFPLLAELARAMVLGWVAQFNLFFPLTRSTGEDR